MRQTPAAVRRLRRALRLFAALFLGATVLYAASPLVPGLRSFAGELPFVSNSAVKVALLGLCCLYAAGKPRERHGLVVVVVGGHLVSVAAMLLLLVAGQATGAVQLFGAEVSVASTLWGAVTLDGVIAALFTYLYFDALPNLGRSGAPEGGEGGGPTGAGRRLAIVLWTLVGAFGAAAAAYETGAFLPGTEGFFRELPFVTNSVVKVSVLAMVCGYVAADLRRRLGLMYLPVAAHALSAGVLLLYLATAPTGGQVSLAAFGAAWSGPLSTLLWGAALLDGAVCVLLLVLTQAAWYARDDLQLFRPIEYRTLIALAEVLVKGDEEQVPASDVAKNVDRYLSQVRSRRRRFHRWALFAMWLHPLLVAFKAPFSELSAEQRLEHIRSRFKNAVELEPLPERGGRLPPLALLRRARKWLRTRVPVLIRIAQQLTYLGYYNDPRSYDSVGYVPFSERDRYESLDIADREPHPLDVKEPPDVESEELEADVCVVGSGAAGAVLAYHLSERGRDVLVLEKGQYVEPRQFSEDEVEMYGKLYADGMFQQTDDFQFTILQGSCVGGSTVVNNAVCFEPPEPVLAEWNDPGGHDAGLHLPTLRQHVREVSDLIGVKPQDGTRLNPSARKFEEGVTRLGLADGDAMEMDVVDANLDDCFGCGYCNIGCAYGKKLSMLNTVLPAAQRECPGEVRVLSECEVRRLVTVTGPTNRVSHLRARMSDGRDLRVRARDFVVAAGAVASPYLLLRSGVGRDLPVGEKASFNMGAYLTAEFDEKMDAYDGLQISHYLKPEASRGWAMETWWNPPASQAINMPGWFEEHYENMRAYDRLMAVGVLVGTEGNGRIGSSWLGGPAVYYTPTADDLRTMADGLQTLGRILFEAGATRVMANTWGSDEFTSPDELDRLHRIALDPGYITLGTGHPQGGCALSRDPTKGVVDPNFRVHGYGNLYVCDASVFPSSLTVNPQLTIMGLARYASRTIR